jgi:hypothetical protein
MTDLEQSLVRRWSGARIVKISLVIGCVGLSPLLLYIVFGPRDGNPIGLALLAMAALPVAAVGVFVGLVKLLLRRFFRSES